MPDIFSAEKRAAVPDPIAELATQAYQEWEKIQKAADQNSDGLIFPAEWPEKELRKLWPPLAELEFSGWDTNQDGQVSQQEAQVLLNIAYGIKHVDGSDLRSENGWVVYRSYFTGADKNKDHRLSKEEYLPSIRWPEEKVLALFQELDVDKNESLSIQELKKTTTSYIDEFNFFLRTDKDLDGLLSPEEMGEVNSNDRYPKRLKQGMAAFDTNGDGKFSLKEFRLSPVGCFYVTLRLSGQKDQDHDARLSWQEFYTEPAPQLMGLLWEQFKTYDRNQSGFLEPDEYEFQITPSKLAPENAFTFSDLNGDQHLEQDEYLALASNLSPKLAKRNFHFVDYNGDQKLSLKEYQTLPNLFPPEKRAPVPDPIADLATSAQQRWQKIWKAADQNADGLLTEKEWPQEELKKQLPPLEKLIFSNWDQDGNGQVTEKEARQLIDVAYGMKHVDGSSLRNPNGQVLYRFYIQRTDKNGDHRLSKEEYLPSIRLPKEKVEELFTQMDADKDGFLTYPEMRRTSNTNIDEFAYFLSRDSDLDGLLSAEELLKFNSNDSTPKRLPQGMAAFDEDGDGKLSLNEYRLAPVGISYVTLRVYDRIDTNLDARLSWEEFYAEPAPQLIGLAWELFSRYDRDQSGQLELDEFEFRIDSSKMSPENAFTARDQDQNGTLSEEEYLSTIPQARQKAAQRDFHLVDYDQNGQLSFTEYQTLPDLFPPEKRGSVPDPVVELATAAQQTCAKLFKGADANADGQLSESEWPLKELTQKLPPLSEVKFRDWDRNQNSQISEQEVQDLIDIAYGLKHVTGAPLRTPDGRTLYRSYITYADKNGDNRLSREEYIPSIRRPKEQVASLFAELDVNRDGSLDYVELAGSHLSNIDELKFFQRSDTDFDGLLSVEELAKVNSNDSTRERIPQGMAAFDSNQDGHFSLKEFRLSPMGCNYVTLRVYGRQDQDHDGQLSWNEFYTEPSPQLIGLAWELFKRYDRNNNGQLELDEIEFRYNPAKIPPDKYFAVADLNGDGKLTFEEVFTDSVPEQSDVRAYRSYQIRLARAEDKFFQDDQNQDQSLNLDEYIESHKAAELIAERHRRAVGRTTADDGSKWLFPVLGTLNVILLMGVAIFFLRRKTSQGSK
ncbi:hypothetical protein FYZ48_02390 [Gimesia chilikensis]|uniref:EF-hand domain-containing protein n=1 Tax=Gimesia chilikensis TaxID=2605989 RepID=UPI0011EE8BA5|nr:EF-hand domain-containing protein [Gimesia chilikensis]KAA0142363.1 hypothetical protein FYZ48_02390 [Gimesia chilikensis]